MTILPLDVSEPASIREFGRQLEDQIGRLDILINNAVSLPVADTQQRWKRAAARHQLPGSVRADRHVAAAVSRRRARAHRECRESGAPLRQARPRRLNWEKTLYNEWKAYARSKLAMVCFTMELNRRLQQRGSNITALGAHPGFAATDIGRHNSLVTPRNPVGRWFNQKMEKLLDPHRRAGRHAHHSWPGRRAPEAETITARAASRSEASSGKGRVNPIANDVGLEVDCGPYPSR